jgi:hypothetical protein
MFPTLERVGRAIESSVTSLIQELPVSESLPSPSLSVSINANNRHLISHSYLPISNLIMPVCTSQSLPPLRPCLTSHFRQGWGCECTSRLAPSDLGFVSPRIILTNPVSQAVVCFAISFTTSSTRAVIPQNSLLTPKCQRQPPRQYALPHESLASSALLSSCMSHSKLLGILPPQHRLCACTDPLVPPTKIR